MIIDEIEALTAELKTIETDLDREANDTYRPNILAMDKLRSRYIAISQRLDDLNNLVAAEEASLWRKYVKNGKSAIEKRTTLISFKAVPQTIRAVA